MGGLYLSRHGTLTLKPAQIGWIYYGNTNSPFLQSLFSSPIRFLEKGQKMAAFSIDLTNSRAKLDNAAQYVFSATQYRAENEARTVPLYLNFLHGLKDNLMVGFVLETLRQTDSNESQTTVDARDFSRSDDLQSSIDTWQWRVGPSVEFLSSDNALHRFVFHYKRLRWERNGNGSRTTPDTVFKDIFDDTNVDKSWSFGYAFHRFWNASPPSLQAYLADWNHDFGNRLPAGGFHFRGEFFLDGAKNDREYVSLYDQSRIESEFRSMEAQLMTGYGAFNWLELAWKTQLERNWQGSIRVVRNHEPVPGFEERWANTMTWQNTFVVNFANYRYAERLRSRFGWYATSAFDQLYGSLLLPGM
ncbi:MAG: hypothetical protein ACRENG_16175, partial [bacterium]